MKSNSLCVLGKVCVVHVSKINKEYWRRVSFPPSILRAQTETRDETSLKFWFLFHIPKFIIRSQSTPFCLLFP